MIQSDGWSYIHEAELPFINEQVQLSQTSTQLCLTTIASIAAV